MSTRILALLFVALLILVGSLFFGREEVPTSVHIMPDGSSMENANSTHVMPDGSKMTN